MRYVFYINPTAGKGDAQQQIIKNINDYFAVNPSEYKIHITKFEGDACESARAEAQTGDEIRIFACGGEGTVFEVLNGITGHDNVQLGVIPCGSANDFLKFFDDKQCFFSIEEQIKGKPIEMDLIKAGDKYCLNGCSVGMDAVVGRDMALFKEWPFVSGTFAYTLAIVKTFLGKLGITIDISIDGQPPERKNCLFAVIANAPYYGGGYKGAPDAVPYDNCLNFTLIDKISKFKILKFIGIYKKGQHEILDCCSMKKCTSMEFVSEKPIPVNLDGEIIEACSMKFELVKNAVKFVLPESVACKIPTKV